MKSLNFILSFAAFTISFAKILSSDFVWGTATASYQIEGAWDEDGKGPSIWDEFCENPGRIYHNQTGKVADDFYHKYKKDIANMKKLGIKNLRLSFSWPRLLPNGTTDNVNKKGVEFYNDLIDSLIEADIEPWVTLYHWDLPSALNNKSSNGGWLNPHITTLFNDYAEFCFETFGDRVKNWITLNEVKSIAWSGYGNGMDAPGRCSPEYGDWCKDIGGGGDSGSEPYLVAHHSLLAHAKAVKTYRTKYQSTQKGQIGMAMSSNFFEPFNVSNPDDHEAVQRSASFLFGWFADPQVFGNYPKEMRDNINHNRLPKFTDDEKDLLKGSFDFLGVNYYTSKYVKSTSKEGVDYDSDPRANQSARNASGHLIGPEAGSPWLNVYPVGLYKLLNWIKERYDNPPLYIFENGVSVPNESFIPTKDALRDTFRIKYITQHVGAMILAKKNFDLNLKGYFVWSLVDNFEWADGYSVRFGMTYIEYKKNQTRLLKDSAYVYSAIIRGKSKQFNELADEFYDHNKKLVNQFNKSIQDDDTSYESEESDDFFIQELE